MFEKLKDLFLYYSFLGFADKSVDKKFIEWKKEHSYKQITYIAAVTGLIYVIFSIVNRHTAPVEIASLLSNIQLFILAPVAFFISYLGYKRKNFSSLELLLFFAPIFAALTHIYLISHLHNYNPYQTELFLMIFWIYTISGLRFIHAIITSCIVFLVGVVGSDMLYPNDLNSLIIYTAWMSASMIFGFVGGYLLQESQKSTFIKQMELEQVAITDKLTGLYNRVMLDKTLKLELQKASRYGRAFGVLLLDIDFFKSVNDTYGHILGDTVLVEVSRQLKKSIRTSDTVFRWGGEEFIILVPEIDKKGLLTLAEQVRKEIEKIEFQTIGNKTVSIGATLSSADDTVNSVIKRADEGMYMAKESGRNCVKFLPSSLEKL